MAKKKPKAPTLAECRRLAWSVGLIFRIESLGPGRTTWYVTTVPRMGQERPCPWVSISHKTKRVAIRMAYAAFAAMAEERL
jgi:hypothetical protein